MVPKLVASGTLTRLGQIVVIILTCWALLVFVPDSIQLIHQMGTIGLTADNDGKITASDNPAKQKNIVAGDHIDLSAMRCLVSWHLTAACKDTMAIFGGMGGTQYVLSPDQDVKLVVIRDSKSRQLRTSEGTDVTLRSVPSLMTDLDNIGLAADEIGAVIFVGLASLLVWKRPNMITWGFFLYAFWFNPGQYFYFYAFLRQWPSIEFAQESAQAVAEAVGYAGFVQFALHFPNDKPAAFWVRIRPWALSLLVVVLAGLQLASFANAFGRPTECVTRAFFIAGALVDAFVAIALWWRSKSQSPVDRQRTRWVTAGCVIGLTTFVFADSNTATTLWLELWKQPCFGHSLGWWLWQQDDGPSPTVLRFFYLGNMVLVAAVFHAIRRHRVIDVNFALSRAFVLLLMGCIWLLVTSAIEHMLERSFEEHMEHFGDVPFFLLVAALGGFTITFEKIRERLNDFSDFVCFPRLHKAKKHFENISEALLVPESFEQIEQLLVNEPVAALDLASAAVFRNDNETFRRTLVHGWDDTMSTILPKDCTTVPGVRASDDSLQMTNSAWSKVKCPQGAALPVLRVPIGNHESTFAFVLYGAHNTGDDLNGDERKMLIDLAHKAANAYEHVEVLLLDAEVEHLHMEVERLKQQLEVKEMAHTPDTITKKPVIDLLQQILRKL
jgi:hypothetical protein